LASLFEGHPEEALLETYGPGKADNETMDEGIMDVANDIFKDVVKGIGQEEQKGNDGNDGAEVKDAAMVIKAFGITSLDGHGKFGCPFFVMLYYFSSYPVLVSFFWL
jgi:hypothetical protein